MWIWLWLVFVFVLLLLPLSYGWGYRRWGPPYPPYYRRRRLNRSEVAYAEPGVDGWGLLADLLWVALIIALVWLVLAAAF